MIRLVTVIGHGIELLPHFISNYRDMVDEINIVVYSSLNYPNLEDDIKLFIVDTAYGDGCYSFKPTGLSDDRYVGTECGVDAGMLCVISLEDAKKLNPNVDTTSGVVVKNFSDDVDSDGKGNILSNYFEIYTDDSDIENDDDEYYY